MTGYLQRLFDRGGGDAPMPAAASMSPVAQADQRLTVPGIGEALMWQAPAFGLDAEPAGEGPVPGGLTPPPPARRMLETPSTRPEMPIRPLMVPPPAPTVAPPQTAEVPASPTPQPSRPPAIPTPIRQVGAIDASDLELPADTDSTALPTAPRALQPTAPEPVEPTPGPAAPAIVDRGRPAAEPVPPPRPATPALDVATPVERDVPAREPAAAQPAPTPEPAAPRLAEPAPPAPVLAMPAPLAEPPPLEVAPPAQAAPHPTAPRPEPRRTETIRAPEPARPPRPLTANEVSVIGPLPASRRPATMFGVRRR